MKLTTLLDIVTDKNKFLNIDDYIEFTIRYLEYIENNLQARIVSQNEMHYQFFQYRDDGGFNITRPLNTSLLYELEQFEKERNNFKITLEQLTNSQLPPNELRENMVRTIYTIQQSIGAALDGLPAGMSNQARKINGDLFERLIRILVVCLNIECVSGTMQVPIKDDNGNELFKSSYQHDLLISKNNELKIIGSVKTSSKDRIDKVFMDKFLYNKLTETSIPHIAIFLNDVQRKKTKNENEYGISSTFLPGHFKAFSIKLNPLDGVYYCDIRPNMINDELLSRHIKTIDHFFYSDLWDLIKNKGELLEEISIKKDD